MAKRFILAGKRRVALGQGAKRRYDLIANRPDLTGSGALLKWLQLTSAEARAAAVMQTRFKRIISSPVEVQETPT